MSGLPRRIYRTGPHGPVIAGVDLTTPPDPPQNTPPTDPPATDVDTTPADQTSDTTDTARDGPPEGDMDETPVGDRVPAASADARRRAPRQTARRAKK